MKKGNCNQCRYKGKLLYTQCGCKLFSCSIRGEVPFWTNNEKLLNDVECDSYVNKNENQQEFDFN